jgi:hypothetical protein
MLAAASGAGLALQQVVGKKMLYPCALGGAEAQPHHPTSNITAMACCSVQAAAWRAAQLTAVG